MMMVQSFLILAGSYMTAAFVITTKPSHSNIILQSTKVGKKNDEEVIAHLYHEWQDEREHVDAMVHVLEDDVDLGGCVDVKPQDDHHRYYMEKESHVHDSLWNEVEHSLENDPDLFNIVTKKKSAGGVNKDFMKMEAHRHDSLFDEVAHALDNDPYF
mmetsp:Transcript_14199/g.20980  ORF Transcript_14199/g.20980 Transcript_14199/m.20980 type:complete len:157 (+) Transcript_14199:69-539(+)|eukprot:CAMPEP_0194220566 /NCGR_PEP_ID=MMETSP0156-20130528/28710_1 /TAXON_ID=33649 /ORGANISM="Thalassionema nitzschioides, Strain L26-B" /LENGTH=156 /DNA_ID=CAMNT_0038950655 /DNA_START=37 /DNA_END=507 /DNA_ORIENTATION=-